MLEENVWHLARHIGQLSLGLDGYLVIYQCVGVMHVECSCGMMMKVYNFSLDVVLCAFCRDVVSEPHGKNIKLLNGVSELPRSVLRRRIDNASVLSYESARSGH